MAHPKKHEEALWRKSGLAGKMDTTEHTSPRETGRKYPLMRVSDDYSPESERRKPKTSNEPIDISPSRVRSRVAPPVSAAFPHAAASNRGFSRKHSITPPSTPFERKIVKQLALGKSSWQIMHDADTPAEKREAERIIASNGVRKAHGFRTRAEELNLNELRARADVIISSRKPVEKVKKWRRKVLGLFRR